MAKVVKRTFSLTEEQAAFIDRKVASGDYVSGSEVVRNGLRGMQEDEAAIERWLVEDVLPAAKEMDDHPERGIPVDEAFDQLLAELEAEPSGRKRA